jgi:methyl-accepting chemotaxis protein
MKLSFRHKIFFILIFFGLLPLLIFSFNIFFLSSYFLKETIFSNLEEITRLLSVETEDFVLNSFNDILILSENPILKSSKISLEEKSKELNKIVKYYPRFQDITFVDEYGNTLCSTSFRFYGKWQTNAWFEKAKEKKEIVMSEIYAISDPKEPILSFFAPVFDEEGKFSFLMAVQINMERFFEIFDRVKVGKEGYAFLINSRGDILAHPNREFLFDKISLNYPLKEAFEKKEGRIEFNFKNTDFVATFKNVALNQISKVETPKWQTIVVQPKKEAFVLLNSLKKQIYLLTLIFFLFIIFLSVFLSRLISQPLKELTLATEKIAKGNFDVQIKSKRTDEFGELAKFFNQMTKKLGEYFFALEESKKVLEIRVKARTKELEELNKALEEKVQERTKELQEKLEELEKMKKELEEKIIELEKFREITVGRELKMIELKKEIEKLKKEIGKYKIKYEPK